MVRFGYKATNIENGCEDHPDCFTCPFEDCTLGRLQVTQTPLKKARAIALHQEGHDMEEIAKELSQSRNIILRWLKSEDIPR